jgi:NADH-quinone oxidoreductase subunit L
MSIIPILAVIVQFAPLVGFAVALFWGKRMGEPRASYVPVAMMGVSAVASIPLLAGVLAGHGGLFTVEWINSGAISINIGYMLDKYSAVMAATVAVVAFLIHVYSIGYMHGDVRFGRFFAYMNLFAFSMLGLVTASNFMQLFIFWELVGLCSYLLIGFWYEKKSASDAGIKAFITTRTGDVGFMLGIFLLFALTGTMDFDKIFLAVEGGAIGPTLITAAALLLFCGAIGKSAQIPLQVWLPDAMEGPTPVSALIHAATMVCAGVFMIARVYPIFEQAPVALFVVALVGGTTALLAATIALVQIDIKRVLAYSTVSQLGYMILALGVGNPVAAFFHLVTHAFFKSLLFLGSGSMIHGSGTQDIREMGGLAPKMKTTTWTFVVGALALAGVPPLAGFFSKDEILGSVSDYGHWWLIVCGFLTALLTAFYMFRAIYVSYAGKPRTAGAEHAHESPPVMTIPLIVLAIFSITAGWIFFIPGGFGAFSGLSVFLHHEHGINVGAMGASVILALSGIFIATIIYLWKWVDNEQLYKIFRPVAFVLERKYFFDDFYHGLAVPGFVLFSRFWGAFDLWVIDGIVNLSAFMTVLVSRFEGWFDLAIVDGVVNLLGWITRTFGTGFRKLQTGYVQEYIIILGVGAVAVILAALAIL